MSADEEEAVQAELEALIALQNPKVSVDRAQEESSVRLPDVPQVEPVEEEVVEDDVELVNERRKEERELVPA